MVVVAGVPGRRLGLRKKVGWEGRQAGMRKGDRIQKVKRYKLAGYVE